MRKILSYILLMFTLVLMPMHIVYAYDTGFITSKDQLKSPGVKIGVGVGSSSMLLVEKEFPNAELVYIELNEALPALAQGKIDAFVYDYRQLQIALATGVEGVKLLDETMDEEVHIAVGLSPATEIDGLKEKIDTFIDVIRADGTLDDMYVRWVIKNDFEIPDFPEIKNPKMKLIVGTSGIATPYTFYQGDELCGYDIELAERLAQYLDADLEFKVYDYGAIINAAASGDVDCIMANLNVTPERAQALPFSQDLYTEKAGIIVRSGVSDSSIGAFFNRVVTSFEKTFIRENRWTLFVRGVITTIIITVSSVILGTVSGFFVYLLCRKGNKVANSITNGVMKLIQGMPVVVLLMILYYIIFAGLHINGIIVSVIGFTLTFAAAVIGLLRIGIGAVDNGQYEAAYSLGYSDHKIFFKIILPQALPHVIGAYKGEIVGLIKATAIVGYIAVQDLTKIGDIIRSRTYDAFFPLIAIAIIYFGLEALLGAVIDKMEINIDFKKKGQSGYLKGVKLNDKD